MTRPGPSSNSDPEATTGAHARGPRRPVPTLFEAALPILTMLALFAAVALGPGFRGELLVVVLLGATAVAGLVARRYGVGWDAIQAATGRKIADVLPALLILLAIGLLIATWMLAGTIPYMVYWGVRLISPRYLIVTAFLATAMMSLFTGTSWGSAGTIGVALMGTAAALGAPVAATAGAVVSGAYLGDKMSPLSDMTNIAAIGAGAPLFAHIRHMMYTATPSFVACLVVFTLAGGSAGAAPPEADAFLAQLERLFRLSPLVLLPPVVVLWGIVRRTPPALAITASSVVAVGLGIGLQHFPVGDALAAAVSGFHHEMLGPDGAAGAAVTATGAVASGSVAGTAARAGAATMALDPRVVTLVDRGGLFSMGSTLVIVIAAFLLAGAMESYGALERLIDAMLGAVRGVFGLIAATMAAGATMIALTSHGGVTALVVGGLFQKAYDERGLARVNLSRSLEDSVTLTEPIMPWTVSAVFMATTLGVPTVHYLPWAVFNYGGPIFSLTIAATYRLTGFGIRKAAARPPAVDVAAADLASK